MMDRTNFRAEMICFLIKYYDLDEMMVLKLDDHIQECHVIARVCVHHLHTSFSIAICVAIWIFMQFKVEKRMRWISQSDLADYFNVNQSSISKYTRRFLRALK